MYYFVKVENTDQFREIEERQFDNMEDAFNSLMGDVAWECTMKEMKTLLMYIMYATDEGETGICFDFHSFLKDLAACEFRENDNGIEEEYESDGCYTITYNGCYEESRDFYGNVFPIYVTEILHCYGKKSWEEWGLDIDITGEDYSQFYIGADDYDGWNMDWDWETDGYVI